jgi:Protein of unknown function (DUF4199)
MGMTIKWGLTLALVLTLWTAAGHLLGFNTVRLEYADIADRLAFVVPLTVLTLAMVEQRRLAGGSISWWAGVRTGVAVATISAPPSLFMLWLYHHFVNPAWLDLTIAHETAKLESLGRSTEQITAAVARLQVGGTDRQQILGGFLGTVAMGVVLSSIISLVLRASQMRGARRVTP